MISASALRVLYVVEGPAPYGANKSLLDLIDFVRVRGVQPYVVSSREGPFTEWLKKRGIPYRALGHRFSTYPNTGTFWRKLFFVPLFLAFRLLNLVALVQLIRIGISFKPNIIHTNIGPVGIGYLASRVLGVKHIWHLREYQDLDFGMKYFPSKSTFIRQLGRSARVICVTDAVRQHFGCPQNALVIHNGVAYQSERALVLPKEDYFLFVGRLEPTKGIEQAILAYAEYAKDAERPLKLFVAGGGSGAYVEKLRLLVDSNVTKGSVELLGFREDTAELMQRAKALIVASEYEGFGRITAEAMFNGCLVIGKNSGGTAVILGASKIGLLFDHTADLVARLREVADMSHDEYVDIVRAAQNEATSKYCVEQYAAAVMGVYKCVASPDLRSNPDKRAGVA